jgi:hypothetical protein
MQVNCLPETDPTSELIYAELLLSGRLIPATVSTTVQLRFCAILTPPLINNHQTVVGKNHLQTRKFQIASSETCRFGSYLLAQPSR